MSKYSHYQLRVHTHMKTKKNPNGVLYFKINENRKSLAALENAYNHGKLGFIVLMGRPDGYEPLFDNQIYDGTTVHPLSKNTKYSRPRLFREWLKEYLI